MIEIYRNDLIYSISYALDFVERDVVPVSNHHSKRVAYLAASMGKKLGYPQCPSAESCRLRHAA